MQNGSERVHGHGIGGAGYRRANSPNSNARVKASAAKKWAMDTTDSIFLPRALECDSKDYYDTGDLYAQQVGH